MNGNGSSKFLGFALVDLTMFAILGLVTIIVLACWNPDRGFGKGGGNISTNTAGVVVLYHGDQTFGLLMVSDQGRVAYIPADVCIEQPKCKALVDKLVKAGKSHDLYVDQLDGESPGVSPSQPTVPKLGDQAT